MAQVICWDASSAWAKNLPAPTTLTFPIVREMYPKHYIGLYPLISRCLTLLVVAVTQGILENRTFVLLVILQTRIHYEQAVDASSGSWYIGNSSFSMINGQGFRYLESFKN